MVIHSSTIAWKIPWREEPGRLQSMGSQRVRHDWETSLSLSLSWRPTRTYRTNIKKKKDVLFITGDWNAKVGCQETLGVTGKFGLGVWNEAGQRLIVFCQENTLVIANPLFQQHKRRLYTWTSPDGKHWNWIDYILCSQRWRSSTISKNKIGSWLWLRSWTPYCQNQT